MNKRKSSKNNKDGRRNRNKHGDDDSKQITQGVLTFKNKVLIGLLLYGSIASAVYWTGEIELLQSSTKTEKEIFQNKTNPSNEAPLSNTINTGNNNSKIFEKSKQSQKMEDKGEASRKKKNENKNSPKSVSQFQFHVQKTLNMLPILKDEKQVIRSWQEILPKKQGTNTNVRIFVMDNFISSRECDGLMRAHDNHVTQHSKYEPIICFSDVETMKKYLHQAGVKWTLELTGKDFLQGTRCLNESYSSQLKGKLPWSYSTSFYPGESTYSHYYENYAQKYTGLDARNGGKFQVTSYGQGVGYKIHTDCTENAELRDRFATILVYLQDVEEGGETEFTELGVSISPKKGRALVWNNMDQDGKCDPTSLHKANPVIKGKKYILQRWYYYHNFPLLGKRSDSPSLPLRAELTPRVTCDQFNSGSCRWYDEWNYDHLIR